MRRLSSLIIAVLLSVTLHANKSKADIQANLTTPILRVTFDSTLRFGAKQRIQIKAQGYQSCTIDGYQKDIQKDLFKKEHNIADTAEDQIKRLIHVSTNSNGYIQETVYSTIMPFFRGWEAGRFDEIDKTYSFKISCINNKGVTVSQIKSFKVSSRSKSSIATVYISKKSQNLSLDYRDCTQSQPCNGATADRFDAIMRSIPEKANINILPGVYETYGYGEAYGNYKDGEPYDDIFRPVCWLYDTTNCQEMSKGWSPKHNWTLSGASELILPRTTKPGLKKNLFTTLKLIGMKQAERQGFIIGGQYHIPLNHVTIKNIILDANLHGQINKTCFDQERLNRIKGTTFYLGPDSGPDNENICQKIEEPSSTPTFFERIQLITNLVSPSPIPSSTSNELSSVPVQGPTPTPTTTAQQPAHTNGVATAGINLTGSNHLIDNVKIINFGTGTKTHECFAISGGNGHTGMPHQKNFIVRNSEISHPARGSLRETTFVAIGGTVLLDISGQPWKPKNAHSDGSYDNVLVENSYFDATGATNRTQGGGGSGKTAGIIRGNHYKNIRVGQYADTWHSYNVTIENNLYENVMAPVQFNFAGNALQSGIENLIIRNNKMYLHPYIVRPGIDMGAFSSGVALGGSGQKPSYTFPDVTITNNLITYYTPTDYDNSHGPIVGGTHFAAWGIGLFSVGNAAVTGNKILLNRVDPNKSNSIHIDPYNHDMALIFYGDDYEENKINCTKNTSFNNAQIFCNRPVGRAARPTIDTQIFAPMNIEYYEHDPNNKDESRELLGLRVNNYDESANVEAHYSQSLNNDGELLNPEVRPFIYAGGRIHSGDDFVGDWMYGLHKGHYVQIKTRDAAGNIAQSPVFRIPKDGISDPLMLPTQPIVSASFTINRSNNTASILFSTNRDCKNARAAYLKMNEFHSVYLDPFHTQYDENRNDKRNHTITINNLDLSQKYEIRVVCEDSLTGLSFFKPVK